MGTDKGIVKYLVKVGFEVDGVVEKADIIGAIFGQTEGLFGPEMNLQELQKTWKVGRIEISLKTKNGKTTGEVLVPMNTDISTAALIAAAVESVDKVGPCSAHFKLISIDDVRALKRKAIVDRAKEIVKEWASKTATMGEEALKDLAEATKRARLIKYGREGLPAGPGVYTSDTVYLVEGRADVINLLRAGIENVVAIEGTKIPETIVKLGREKKLIAFLDGDRAGDLILKELNQLVKLEGVIRAPEGREVEELTPMEVIELVEKVKPVKPKPKAEVRVEIEAPLLEVVKELYPSINGTLEAVVLDEELREVKRLPVSELVKKDKATVEEGAHLVFDGIITERLAKAYGERGFRTVIGIRKGSFKAKPEGLRIYTFRDLGLA